MQFLNTPLPKCARPQLSLCHDDQSTCECLILNLFYSDLFQKCWLCYSFNNSKSELSFSDWTSFWHLIGVLQMQLQLQLTNCGVKRVKWSSNKARIAINNFTVSRGSVAELKYLLPWDLAFFRVIFGSPILPGFYREFPGLTRQNRVTWQVCHKNLQGELHDSPLTKLQSSELCWPHIESPHKGSISPLRFDICLQKIAKQCCEITKLHCASQTKFCG